MKGRWLVEHPAIPSLMDDYSNGIPQGIFEMSNFLLSPCEQSEQGGSKF
jgi:hypothetical protein